MTWILNNGHLSRGQDAQIFDLQYQIDEFLEGTDTMEEDTQIEELVVQLDDSFTTCNQVENVTRAITLVGTRFECDTFYNDGSNMYWIISETLCNQFSFIINVNVQYDHECHSAALTFQGTFDIMVKY